MWSRFGTGNVEVVAKGIFTECVDTVARNFDALPTCDEPADIFSFPPLLRTAGLVSGLLLTLGDSSPGGRRRRDFAGGCSKPRCRFPAWFAWGGWSGLPTPPGRRLRCRRSSTFTKAKRSRRQDPRRHLAEESGARRHGPVRDRRTGPQETRSSVGIGIGNGEGPADGRVCPRIHTKAMTAVISSMVHRTGTRGYAREGPKRPPIRQPAQAHGLAGPWTGSSRISGGTTRDLISRQ